MGKSGSLLLIVAAAILLGFYFLVGKSSVPVPKSPPPNAPPTQTAPVKTADIGSPPETFVKPDLPKPENLDRKSGDVSDGVPIGGAVGKSPIEAAVARVKDTSIPVEQREKELTEIARRKDAEALDVLRAIGDERVYLNFVAVETLGNFSNTPLQAVAAAYLKGKLANPDSQVLCAAIRAYARLLGEKAVPGLTEALKNNRERPDGHEELVCTAAVNALRDIGCPAAIPALLVELERSEEKGWSLEYGSELLAALKNIGVPEGKAGAAAYARRLAARIPDDPLAKEYFEKKIAEAKEIAAE